jgi:hypothetical protein
MTGCQCPNVATEPPQGVNPLVSMGKNDAPFRWKKLSETGIQYFDMIGLVTDFRPQGLIANIEIQPVTNFGDHCEHCEIGREDFSSVYGEQASCVKNTFRRYASALWSITIPLPVGG